MPEGYKLAEGFVDASMVFMYVELNAKAVAEAEPCMFTSFALRICLYAVYDIANGLVVFFVHIAIPNVAIIV